MFSYFSSNFFFSFTVFNVQLRKRYVHCVILQKVIHLANLQMKRTHVDHYTDRSSSSFWFFFFNLKITFINCYIGVLIKYLYKCKIVLEKRESISSINANFIKVEH